MANTQNYFLPFLRTGMAAKIAAPTTSGKRLTMPINATAKAAGNSQQARLNIALYGAGDVLGFHERIVANTYPKHNIGNFNASYIPFIEFKEPDFLWRYSGRKEGKYWLPWLSLVVLKNEDGGEEGEFELLPPANPNLPARIKLTGDKQPNLQETWRWAHIHTNDKAKQSKAYIQQKIVKAPHTAVCRLTCPRRLKASTAYTAFVIPTYQLGVEVGLGQDIELSSTTPDMLAWEGTSGKNLTIPYYYKWEFRTGIRGDFEYLVKQLEFRQMDDLGTRSIDCSNPGYGMLDKVAEPMNFEGALQSVEFERTALSSDVQNELKEVLKKEIENEGTADEIRRLTPPIYGKWYVEQEKQPYEHGAAGNKWLNELNHDFRHRYAASLGVQFVKDNQEQLMKSAWEQLREVKKANRAANIGKFGRAVSSCMHKRLGGLSAEKLFTLSTCMHSKMRMQQSESESSSIHAATHNSMLTNMSLQAKTRKYRVRKFDKQQIRATSSTAQRMNFTIVTESQVLNIDDNPISIAIDQAKATDLVQEARGSILEKINPKNTIEKHICDKIEPFRQENASNKDVLRPIVWHPEFHAPMYRYLRDKSQAYLLPGVEHVPQNTVTLLATNNHFIESFMVGLNHEFAAELRWREYPTDMRGSYFRKFWDTTIYSLDESEKQQFRNTTIAQALVTSISKQYAAYNTIAKIEHALDLPSSELTDESRAVAEAYETAVEKWLLSREEDKDIVPLHQWRPNSKLGTHAKQSAGDNQIVLLLRGDILNKFPNTLVYLAKQEAGKPNYSKRLFPIFEGNLPPDIILLGFPISTAQSADYFLVFEEPMDELQYGLDETDAPATSAGANDTSWKHFGNSLAEDFIDAKSPSNIDAANWDNPAFIASVFTQKSVRLAIPLKRFF